MCVCVHMIERAGERCLVILLVWVDITENPDKVSFKNLFS